MLRFITVNHFLYPILILSCKSLTLPWEIDQEPPDHVFLSVCQSCPFIFHFVHVQLETCFGYLTTEEV